MYRLPSSSVLQRTTFLLVPRGRDVSVLPLSFFSQYVGRTLSFPAFFDRNLNHHFCPTTLRMPPLKEDTPTPLGLTTVCRQVPHRHWDVGISFSSSLASLFLFSFSISSVQKDFAFFLRILPTQPFCVSLLFFDWPMSAPDLSPPFRLIDEAESP